MWPEVFSPGHLSLRWASLRRVRLQDLIQPLGSLARPFGSLATGTRWGVHATGMEAHRAPKLCGFVAGVGVCIESEDGRKLGHAHFTDFPITDGDRHSSATPCWRRGHPIPWLIS